jgi:hypothetical protein
MAGVIGNPEVFTNVKECLIYETKVETMLVKKIPQFKLPAEHSVRIPAGEAQGFTPIRPPRANCHIWPRRG